MNQCLAQLENTEMYSKILFLYKKVLNKYDNYFINLKWSIAHHKACVTSCPPRCPRKKSRS